MPIALTLLAIVAVVIGVSALARRYGASAPLVLTAVGIVISFAPMVPEVTVGPEVILLGILPPLLYAAAIRTSLVDLGANKNVIGLLSVGLVIFTAAGVGLVTWWLMGDPVRRRRSPSVRSWLLRTPWPRRRSPAGSGSLAAS